MGNQFLKGLQRPAIMPEGSSLPDYSEANEGDVLQIQGNEPVWGAVEALPEIEETDEGKVLSVDQGEAVWADAPSGLPEITNADEGKVLTVVGEAEPVVTYYLPEQTITLTTGQGTVTGADFSGLSDGDKATLTLTIDGKTTTTEGELWGTAFAFGRSSDIDSTGAVNLSAQDVGFEVLEMSGEKTATLSISATTEGEKTYSAQWETPSGGYEPYIIKVNLTGTTTGTLVNDFAEAQQAVADNRRIILQCFFGTTMMINQSINQIYTDATSIDLRVLLVNTPPANGTLELTYQDAVILNDSTVTLSQVQMDVAYT